MKDGCEFGFQYIRISSANVTVGLAFCTWVMWSTYLLIRLFNNTNFLRTITTMNKYSGSSY